MGRESELCASVVKSSEDFKPGRGLVPYDSSDSKNFLKSSGSERPVMERVEDDNRDESTFGRS